MKKETKDDALPVQKKYKMYLVLGDWSEDGHGKSQKVLIESNKPVANVQQAYKDSCKLTGISFNHNEDYTGKKRNWEDADNYRIGTEYEETRISPECIETLQKFDIDIDVPKDGDVYLDKDLFIELWIKFVQLSDPDLKLELCDKKDDIPNINGFWDKKLNVQFGYALFT